MLLQFFSLQRNNFSIHFLNLNIEYLPLFTTNYFAIHLHQTISEVPLPQLLWIYCALVIVFLIIAFPVHIKNYTKLLLLFMRRQFQFLYMQENGSTNLMKIFKLFNKSQWSNFWNWRIGYRRIDQMEMSFRRSFKFCT